MLTKQAMQTKKKDGRRKTDGKQKFYEDVENDEIYYQSWGRGKWCAEEEVVSLKRESFNPDIVQKMVA